jgi:hypothetical protein
MAEIIDLGGKSISVKFDADETLRQLIGRLDDFVLAGYDKDGNEITAITFSHLPEALWALERCKKSILERTDED